MHDIVLAYQIQTGKVLDLFHKRIKDICVPDEKRFWTLSYTFTQLLMHIDDPFIHRHLFQRMWRLYISILIHPSAKTKFRQILIGRIKCKGQGIGCSIHLRRIICFHIVENLQITVDYFVITFQRTGSMKQVQVESNFIRYMATDNLVDRNTEFLRKQRYFVYCKRHLTPQSAIDSFLSHA